jgi:hypothetical protein
LGGERIVTSSDDPEHDACRILAARGYTGPIEFTDGITGKLRITIPKIEVAALYRMQESARGLRLVRRREGPRGSPRTAAGDVAGTGDPGASRNGLVHAIGANRLDPPTITLVPRRVA